MSGQPGFLSGLRGLIMGVANDLSIAWGIARQASEQGAELAFTFQGDALEKRVRPLAESVNAKLIAPCDVTDPDSMDALFENLGKTWGRLDFVVHAIAFSDRAQLQGRYADTSRENFLRTIDISCFSFTDVCRRAAPMMTEGGALLTLSYYGAERVVPHYNVMGVAKAALEASVRYLATDFGRDNIRVNAMSAGPMKTLASSGIGDFRYILKWNELNAPMHRNVTMDDVGRSGMYLISDLSSGVTCEVHHVDCCYHVVGMMAPESAQDIADLLDGANLTD